MTELLIRGGYLLDANRPLGTGDVLVRDGLIAEIGPSVTAPQATVLEARDKIIMPGLINAHVHSNQALEKGLNDRYPLDLYMLLGSYGGANAEFSPRDLYVSAMVGAIEMIRTGTTSALDMPRVDLRWFQAGIDSIMQAYADIGMRATVAVTYTDLNFPGSLPLELVPGAVEALKPRKTAEIADIFGQVDEFIRRWRGKNPLLVPAVGPSSLPRCSTELFEASVDFAKSRGVRLQTHLLSAKSQVFVGLKRYGGSTVEFLQRIGCLEDWASFAHSIWLDPEEVQLFARSSATMVTNPLSNTKLGVGMAPVVEMRKAGGKVAIGTDGSSSADGQNMFEAIKYTANIHRNRFEYDDWILSEDALRMCWDGGASVLGQRLGRLDAGCAADFTILNLKQLFVTPKEQLVGQIVQSELGGSVDTVMIGGEVVYSGGKFTRIDEEAIHAEAQDILTRVYRGMPEREKKFAEMYPVFRDLERAVVDAGLSYTRMCG